jgi:NAD(P)-dependent dehydrogenase (short-subunit alcohol dehydrogenase family)
VGCDVDAEAGNAAEARVTATGGQLTFVEADVSDESAVQAFAAQAATFTAVSTAP